MVAKQTKLSSFIRDDICAGIYPAGTKLPGERDLAKHYRVSRTTIKKSLDALVQENMLKRAERSGTYVKMTLEDGALSISPKSFVHNKIGILLDAPLEQNIDSYEFLFIAAIQRILSAASYSSLINCPSNNNNIDQEIKMFQGIVDMIVVINTSPLHDPMEKADYFSCPVIVVSSTPLPAGVNQVIEENRKIGHQVIAHLREQGYRRIGIITGAPFGMSPRQRLSGLREALIDAGLFNPELVAVGDNSRQSGGLAFRQLMSLSEPPEAVVVCGFTMTCGVYDVASQMNISIGSDVAVVGYHDAPSAALMDPPLTVVQLPLENMSAQVVAAITHLKSNPHVPFAVEVPSKLIIRQSTPVRSKKD